jgi:phage gp36-like protein
MSYCTEDDLKKKIDEAVLIQLTDTTNSDQIDSAKVDRAIRDADALIDSYASKMYKAPMNPVPHLVCELSATLAIHNLHRFRSIESPVWSEAGEKAIELLTQVSKGLVTLEGAIQEPKAADDVSSTSTFSAQDRRFSRELLKDM